MPDINSITSAVEVVIHHAYVLLWTCACLALLCVCLTAVALGCAQTTLPAWLGGDDSA